LRVYIAAEWGENTVNKRPAVEGIADGKGEKGVTQRKNALGRK